MHKKLRLYISDSKMQTIPNMCTELQRKIAEYYTVYPVLSARAFEKFTQIAEKDTPYWILTHKTFKILIQDASQKHPVIQCFQELWKVVKQEWPKNTLVMWRRYPEVITCDDDSIILIMRLGGLSPLETPCIK